MKFLKKQIVSDSFLPVREALISSIHDLSRKSCCQRRFHRVAIKYISKCTVSCSTVWFEYLNKITWFVVIIVCLQTRPVKVKTQTKTNIWCKITVFIIAIEINFHAVCAFEVIFNSCYWYFIRSWITTGVLHWHQIPVFFIDVRMVSMAPNGHKQWHCYFTYLCVAYFMNYSQPISMLTNFWFHGLYANT